MQKRRTEVKDPGACVLSEARCEHCGSTRLKRTLATYPVPLTGKLAGRRIDVYRVEVDECRNCKAITPTSEGKAKVARCTKKGIEVFLTYLP